MTDDLHKALGGQKPYRRKRTSQHEMFSDQKPPTMQEVNKGVWCTRCKARHPYNGSDRVRLKTQYEKRGATWILHWLCPNSGDVVGQIVLGGTSERSERDTEDQQ